MAHDIRKSLTDILIAIGDIHDFLGNEPDFDDYQANLMQQYAVERALGIIGEATNRVRQQWPDVPISHIKQIVNLRNIVIHAYDDVDDQRVWGVIHSFLPLLEAEVKALMKDVNSAN